MRSVTLLALCLTAGACTGSGVDTDLDPDTSVIGDPDADSDGFAASVDCDDTNPNVYPGAIEVCDGLDTNCDGEIDNDPSDAIAFYVDADGDSFGAGEPIMACAPPEGTVDRDGDCDDTSADIHPDAEEVPDDGIDQDCSGADSVTCYEDSDGDGFGNDLAPIYLEGACGVGQELAMATDCNDSDASVYPGAPELCDGQVNACGGALPTIETDTDGDGYVECDIVDTGWQGVDSVVGGSDCDPNRGTIYPSAPELCDGLINTCSGQLSGNERDLDTDGFVQCLEDAGGWQGSSVAGFGDCDDNNSAIYPGAVQLCDGKDNACNGVTEPAGAVSFESFNGSWTDLTPTWGGTGTAEVTMATTGTVWFCPGTYKHPIKVTGSGVTLAGRAGAGQTILTGGRERRIISSASSGLLTVRGLTLQDGSATYGGAIGIPANRSLTVTDSVIKDSFAYQDGGGIYSAGGAVTLNNVSMSGNIANLQGGALWLGLPTAAAVLNNATLFDNISNGGGAITLVGGPLTLNDSELSGNEATSMDGGAILIAGNSPASVLTLNRTVVQNNTAKERGGGVSVQEGATILMQDSEFRGNTAESGGGVNIDLGPFTLTCNRDTADFAGFYSNTATEVGDGTGGAVQLYAAGTIISNGCDWGIGDTNNSPRDLGLAEGINANFENNANFSCTEEGC